MECGKKKYASRHAAKKAMKQLRRFGGQEMREYRCHICRHAWHLSTDKQVGNVDRGDWIDD